MFSRDIKLLESWSRVSSIFADYSNIFEEIFVIILAKKQDDKNYEKKWVPIYDNIFVFPIYSRSHLLSLFWLLKSIWGLKKKVDIITVQDPFEAGFLALLVAKLLGLKIQIQVHTDFLSPHYKKISPLNRARVWLAKLVLKRADCIRVVSSQLKKEIVLKIKLKTTPTVLPIFVDIEKNKSFTPTTNLKEQYPQFEKIILMASRFSKEKNFPLAISAFEKVLATYPKAGLIIVGSGPERNKIEELIIKKQLGQSVVLLGWTNDLVSYYKTTDLFLVTSDYEGFGMTIVEALASGLPVVSTPVGIAFVAGAKITKPTSENISLTVIESLSQAPLGVLNKNAFCLDKAEYLERYKESFLVCN